MQAGRTCSPYPSTMQTRTLLASLPTFPRTLSMRREPWFRCPILPTTRASQWSTRAEDQCTAFQCPPPRTLLLRPRATARHGGSSDSHLEASTHNAKPRFQEPTAPPAEEVPDEVRRMREEEEAARLAAASWPAPTSPPAQVSVAAEYETKPTVHDDDNHDFDP